MQSIPSQILKDTITLKVPVSVDEWNNATYAEYSQGRVHIQGANKLVKNKENTEVQLKSLLFVDLRKSTPFLDWSLLQHQAEQTGHEMRVVHGQNEYAVIEVDDVPDPYGQLHHYEVGLV